MGKPLSDKISAETMAPIILNPKTVNNYKDSTVLSTDEVQTADNVIFDDDIVEKVLGTVKANSDTFEGGTGVDGLHRSYGPGTEKILLRLNGGSLKSGPAAFGTTVLSGLSSTALTPFINLRGKSYGVNTTDGIIRYDPKTTIGIKTSINCPLLKKKIAFFESDETWSGGSADTAAYRPDEWTGNSITSRKTTATVSSSTATSSNITVDLSQFADTKATTNKDYIHFWTKHSTLNNLSYITLEFSSGGTTFATKFMVTLYQRDFTQFDNEWTEWKVKLGAFIKTGSPTWATVQAVRFTTYANANGSATVWYDYCHLSAAPIVPMEMKKEIFNCDDDTQETWAGDALYTNGGTDYVPKSGNRMVYVYGSAGGSARTPTCTLTTQVDLSKWSDGASTQDSDEIVFYVMTNDTTAINGTNPLTLRIGTDASNYYYYTWTSLTALALYGNNYWCEVRVDKGDVDAASTGSPSWATIGYVAFVTSVITGAAKYMFFDQMSLESFNAQKSIANFESDETWTITGVGGGLTTQLATEGSQCLYLLGYYWGEGETYAVYDCATLDLTAYADASSSSTDDVINIDITAYKPEQYLRYVDIWFDNNSLATFANAYKYRILGNTLISQAEYKKTTVSIKKSSFDKVGTSGGWSTIGAIKILARTQGNYADQGFTNVFFDNLTMTRKPRPAGKYYYKYCFMVRDVHSACSDISEGIESKGNKILLTNIATSADSTVTGRKIYRLGGSSTEWMHLMTIEDNTTTTAVDNLNDEDLKVYIGDEVAQGWVNSVLCSNLIYDPQTNSMLLWGDTSHKQRVYQTHSDYYYAVDEAGYREFPDQVMYILPWYENYFVFYQHHIQKITGDFMTGMLVDLPIHVGACSYYAVGKIINGLVPFCGWDNVYWFDGYQVIAIGDQVRGYFKGRESYLSTVALGYNKECIYIACKDKSGTPTYNDTVLRYYIPKKQWVVLPDWNVSVWCNWDQSDDQNEFYYADSNAAGAIYSINSSTYQFDTTAITSTLQTGWFSVPDAQLRLHKIELKAKGTAASTIAVSIFKDFGGSASATGTVTLTTNWETYVLGPHDLWRAGSGDYISLKFVHSTASAYFKMKDIVLYFEKMSKRSTHTEVTVTVT